MTRAKRQHGRTWRAILAAWLAWALLLAPLLPELTRAAVAAPLDLDQICTPSDLGTAPTAPNQSIPSHDGDCCLTNCVSAVALLPEAPAWRLPGPAPRHHHLESPNHPHTRDGRAPSACAPPTHSTSL